MLQPTPYSTTIEDYNVIVQSTYIELPNFIEPISTFKDNVTSIIHTTGKYTNTDYLNSCDITMEFSFMPTIATDPRLRFIGRFSVSKNERIKTTAICIRLAQYCYGLIESYIKDKPVIDKNGNLYFLPPFTYAEDQFLTVQFE